MAVKNKDEKSLRRYLLGDVSAGEREGFELWLMSDDEAYDLLLAAEDDLIDDSLAGKLSAKEQKLFETYFLAASERQRRVQFGRVLNRYIRTFDRQEDIKPAFWERVRNFLQRPHAVYAVSTLLVLFVISGTWATFKLVNLQLQLHSQTEQIRDSGRERDQLTRELNENRSYTQRLEEELKALESTVAGLKSAARLETQLAVTLMPVNVRSSAAGIPQVSITPNTQLVQFSLALIDDNYTSYRAVLIDAENRQIWTRDHLPSATTNKGKAVVVIVPARLLANSESIRLSGRSGSADPEDISRFDFRVVRK